MHTTLTPKIKGFIDKNIFINNVFNIRGWCFMENTNKNLPLRLINTDGSENKTYIFVEDRIDVVEFYHNHCIREQCGFSFILTTNNCKLQMKFDTPEWLDIFNFTNNNTHVYESNNDNNAFAIELNNSASYIVVDNFYKSPYEVRKFALTQEFNEHKEYHKGKRTDITFKFNGLKERFEEIIGKKIKSWDYYPVNACFQYCNENDLLVYHFDIQQYAGVLFLTPDAPPESGTTLFRSKITKKMKVDPDEHDIVFKTGFLDKSAFDVVDVVGNVYNRLILFDSKIIHAASSYFGKNKEDGRLFQLFFFDLE